LTSAAHAPILVFWTVAIIFGVIMLRREGGRAERFFIAGAGIKILSNLLSIPRSFIDLWLFREDYSSIFSTGIDIFFLVINMIGILCLIYAFWLKFDTKQEIVISS
jgi:hypothetical protein